MQWPDDIKHLEKKFSKLNGPAAMLSVVMHPGGLRYIVHSVDGEGEAILYMGEHDVCNAIGEHYVCMT